MDTVVQMVIVEVIEDVGGDNILPTFSYRLHYLHDKYNQMDNRYKDIDCHFSLQHFQS